MLSKILIKFISKYQKAGGGSRLLLVDCNFVPTCSEYFKQSLSKYGIFKGVKLGFARIRRCKKSSTLTKIEDPMI